MKLSKASKEYVAATVAAAFVDDIKAAEDNVAKVKAACEERYAKFDAYVDARIKDLNEEVLKAAKKYGLTLIDAAGDRPDVSARMYDRMFFETTTDEPWQWREDGYHASSSGGANYKEDLKLSEKEKKMPYRVALFEQVKIDRQVKAAVNRALYEIEVKGSKDELDAIIARAIETAKKAIAK